MERITLKSGEDVKAFIEAQDEARQQACAAFIASRAALRASPIAILFFEFDEATIKRDVTSLFSWRPTLIATVAATMPSDEIRSAAFYAADFAVYDAAAASVAATDRTAVIAGDAVAAAFDAAAARAADFAARAADIWAEVSRDASLWLEYADQQDGTLAMSIAPLWSNENPLERDWHNLREKLRAADTPNKRGADWSFWVKWYDDILAGNPQNWNMLHEIATTDAIDWDASARQVNDKINGIVEAYALKNSYYFERIEFSEAKQKLIVVPEGSFDGANVQTAYQRLRDAIEDVRDAPKEGNWDPEYALRDEIRILERTLDRPTTQPIFVVEKCFDCVKRIQARLDDATIFGHDVEDFQKALDRSAFDIIGIDEDARRIVERRTNENLFSLAKEDRDRLSQFVEEAAPIIDADLKDDFETDLSGDDDPETEGEGSTLRAASRTLRIVGWVKSNPLQVLQLVAAGDALVARAIELWPMIMGFLI